MLPFEGFQTSLGYKKATNHLPLEWHTVVEQLTEGSTQTSKPLINIFCYRFYTPISFQQRTWPPPPLQWRASSPSSPAVARPSRPCETRRTAHFFNLGTPAWMPGRNLPKLQYYTDKHCTHYLLRM
jgi:hypothetical protein